jgi:hypothetical protein
MKQDGGLRVLFREPLPRTQWSSIETGATAGGVPDSEFGFPSVAIARDGLSISLFARDGQCHCVQLRSRG